MATKQQKRELFDAAKEGDLKKLKEALSALLTACGSAEELTALLRSVRSSGRTVAVVAIQSLQTSVKTQNDRVADSTTARVYDSQINNVRAVDGYFEEKALDDHIQARLKIVAELIKMGADVNDETSIPTFNEAAMDVRNAQALAQSIQYNVDANVLGLKLQNYSVALLGLSAKARNDADLQTRRAEQTNRKGEYQRLITRANGAKTGRYERHPLVVAVRYGTVQNVNSKLRDFFQPESDTFFMKINVPSALAPVQYIPTTEKERNRLSPLMQNVLLEAVRFWVATKENTPSRRRTEAILQAIVGAVRGQDAIGDPDLEGWNGEGNTIMDRVWAECLSGFSSGNLTYTREFAPGGAGTMLVNQLTLANPVNRFTGLRFSPNPPGPDSARRPLTAEQERFCANIKAQFLNAAGIPQAQHDNFIWCAVNETTEIYEKSNYGESRQGFRQRFSAYDSQQIARGSVCLCEYGPDEARGKHEKPLNYTFGDFFSRLKYCRVVRAWDYVEFQREDGELAGTIGGAGVLSGIAAGLNVLYVPSLLANGTFLATMLAGGAVTFLALQEYFRENNRIAVGYVETGKLAHRYDTNQPMARFGERFQTDAGALDLSYIYDSYRKAGSKQSADRFARMVQSFFARRRLPQDVGPDPVMGQQAADAVAGTRGAANGLVPGELRVVPERAPRRSFLVGKKIIG